MTRVAIPALVLGLMSTAAFADLPPGVHPSIGAAMTWAEERLTHDGCRLVFSDFADSAGRTLAANLSAAGQTAAQHLRGLHFTNDDRSPMCRNTGVRAFTSPGNPVIHLCIASFTEAAREDARKAGAILIHEQLHALGLEENPPTPDEITQRVLQRCGR